MKSQFLYQAFQACSPSPFYRTDTWILTICQIHSLLRKVRRFMNNEHYKGGISRIPKTTPEHVFIQGNWLAYWAASYQTLDSITFTTNCLAIGVAKCRHPLCCRWGVTCSCSCWIC